MEGFRYEPKQLAQAARELSTGANAVDSELSRLRNRVEPLQQAFQGQAAQGFQELWKEWQDSATRLKASLDGLSKLLNGAAQNAQQMEDANTRLMRG